MTADAIFPETILALLAWRARARSDAGEAKAPWLCFERDTWTLEDVLDEVDRYAVGLAERGVVHGDRIGILLGNCPQTLFAWFAANLLGAIAMPMNPAYKAPELAGLLKVVRPRLVVAREGSVERSLLDASCAALEEASRPELVSPDALARSGAGAPSVVVSPDDVAVLLATSGTTGAPKAVMQTHRTYALTAEAFPWWIGLTASDRLLVALPLFHINAQAYSVMGALGCGGSLALMPRFSASRFWAQAEELGATQFNAVGAIVNILLGTEPSLADREHHVRLCYAALALPEERHRAFEERFGLAMTVGYGLSETTFGTVWPREKPARYGTMGTLRQHPRLGEINRARVVTDDGREAADGEAGELWLDSPGMMRGYWPDATPAHGWFHTGDVVRRDPDGFFTFVARKKDVIRRRGENVAAAEIENVLAAHASIAEAAVVGVPSALGEEEIVAYVVAAPGASVDVEALREWTRARLADFKVPAQIHVRDALPRTATERIAKHLLR
jgi:crotonobetaine/carnitine-CoA ligase